MRPSFETGGSQTHGGTLRRNGRHEHDASSPDRRTMIPEERGTRLGRGLFGIFGIALVAATTGACRTSTDGTEIVLLTTTTTQDSGILEALTLGFERTHPYTVKTIVAGSGDILRQGASGEGDVLLTHSPVAEIAWMQQGN